MLILNDLKVPIDADDDQLRQIIEKKLKTRIRTFMIRKKSLDARKEPHYVCSVLVDVKNEERLIRRGYKRYLPEQLDPPYQERKETCIIIGYGPSGIFSACRLHFAGYKVIAFEKGKRIDERARDVETFFKTGILDPQSNVQFGEGGAGTFSDAKLTTRIKDKYIDYILDLFIRFGASEKIRYENHAHIGTDEIRKIIARITDHLIKEGVEFHFSEPVIDLIMNDRHEAIGVKTSKGRYDADHILLGIGHSAQETYEMLKRQGVHMEKKDIALGFRVEHPQSFIDARQTNALVKEANEYFLRYKGEKGVYSFCMCPGGIVIPAMSDESSIVTNGMSYAARDSGYANSAILIQVFKEEFEDGLEYLRSIERNAYDFSGSYRALAQNIKDFMNNELYPLQFDSTYPLGTVLYDFNRFFQPADLQILKDAFLDFDRKIPGFIEKGIMIGPETRSSSPIRINRDETCQSVNTKNIYPMGEGAGYGGGIMSCALDGIRIANAILWKHEQIQQKR
ncbi:MAG: hypothetical protein IJL85_01695 [Erysipelotrichaceae bacterium]|nr:hypothetical protein [Erysipelotrichaceae bacterium]